MSAIEFQPFPKIARLNRDIIVTEKIDGTNAAVVIVPIAEIGARRIESEDLEDLWLIPSVEGKESQHTALVGDFIVFAQSRNRFITPTSDNYGFAGWVRDNAEALVSTLGEGTHFGEWWGAGIQRGYGLTGNDKCFSLFNTHRWGGVDLSAIPSLDVVPVLYHGPFNQWSIDNCVEYLREQGSEAVRGFPRPEGIVVFHTASNSCFKVTLEKDGEPKAQPRREHDLPPQAVAA